MPPCDIIIKKKVVYNMEIKTIGDVLNLLGSDEPFDFSRVNENPFSDCLTKSGNIAYNNLRNILIFMQNENIITGFDEDKLDRYIDLNY